MPDADQYEHYDLHLVITGLSMLVPREWNRTMYVLAPNTSDLHDGEHEGHGEHKGDGAHQGTTTYQHVVRFAFAASLDPTLPPRDTEDVTYFTWEGERYVEVTADATHNIIKRVDGKEANLDLPSTDFVNLSHWAKTVPREILGDPSSDPRVAASLRLESGLMAPSPAHSDVWWKFKEGPDKCRQMTNRANWMIERVKKPLVLQGANGKKYRLQPPDPQKPRMKVYFSCSTLAERPSQWLHNSFDLNLYRDEYEPPHFKAYHKLVRDSKPNPMYKKNCSPKPSSGSPQPLSTTEAPGKLWGIHPITCIITTGDPEPGGPP
jgi:hypothetical protein